MQNRLWGNCHAPSSADFSVRLESVEGYWKNFQKSTVPRNPHTPCLQDDFLFSWSFIFISKFVLERSPLKSLICEFTGISKLEGKVAVINADF